MIQHILQLILIFVIPYLIIRFKDFKLTKIFGTIGMAYFFGLVVAFIVFILNKVNVVFSLSTDIGQISSYAAIAIGIPLLLFGSNLQEAKKLTGPVLKSFLALIISVMIVSSITFVFYGKNILNGDILSAAAIGLYTGGTPNLNTIAISLFRLNNIAFDSNLVTLANLSDIIIGAFFYVFLLFLAKPIIDKILPYKVKEKYIVGESDMKNTEDFNFKDFKRSKRLLKTFLIAFGMTAISAGAGVLLYEVVKVSVSSEIASEFEMLDFLVPVMLIGVTILGIIGSFNKKIRETEGTNILGHYLILVFSFALASSVDFSTLGDSEFGNIIILYGIITVGSFLIHLLFARLLKIDSDCMIVTATAGIYGPAFVPAITKQLKNENLTVPGLICGSIGYALGTFLGLGLGLIFALGM